MNNAVVKVEETGLAPRQEDRNLATLGTIQQGISLVSGKVQAHHVAPPKLGNIHLGEKLPNGGMRALPHFVLPQNLLDDEEFIEAHKDINEDPTKPTKLKIWLMYNEPGANALEAFELWGQGGKLKYRTLDKRTALVLDERTQEYITRPFEEKDLKNGGVWMFYIFVMLPDAQGFGWWKIGTKSPNSFGGFLREMERLSRQELRGRLAGVDLLLTLDNSRTFHPLVTTRGGESKRIATQPYLVKLVPPYSLRKLTKAINQADGYVEPERVTLDTDNGDAPTAEYQEAETDAQIRERVKNLLTLAFGDVKTAAEFMATIKPNTLIAKMERADLERAAAELGAIVNPTTQNASETQEEAIDAVLVDEEPPLPEAE